MVLGHHSLDNGLSSLGQAFPTVTSLKCVLLRCNKQYFDKHLWKYTLNTELEVKLSKFQKFKFLNALCEQTLYHIMYEYGVMQVFQPGQKVMSQHPRSAMNVEARKMYDKEYG